MDATYRVGRRLFLTAGAGVLGVAILGACSSGSGSAAASSTGTSPGGPQAGATGPLRWHRVSMAEVAAYLLVRGKEVALVDTGNPVSDEEIGAGLKAAGADWASVRHVIFTHLHQDHAGGWPSVEPHLTGATSYAGEDDIPGIGGTTRPKAVKDGDEVFGLRIVATPGHTAGHISVFDADTRVLVAGDALRNLNGLEGPDPTFTPDLDAAKASMKKLAALSPAVVLFGHGTPLEQDAAAALAALVAS